MISTIKRISRPFYYGVCLYITMGNFDDVSAQTWYDSEGRALTIKGNEVRLQTEKEKRQTLPMLEVKPSIVRPQTLLRDDLPTIVPKGRFRNNQFFGSRFRFRNSSFNSFSNSGKFFRFRKFNASRIFFSSSRKRIKRF